jgi:hypothetical protein
VSQHPILQQDEPYIFRGDGHWEHKSKVHNIDNEKQYDYGAWSECHEQSMILCGQYQHPDDVAHWELHGKIVTSLYLTKNPAAPIYDTLLHLACDSVVGLDPGVKQSHFLMAATEEFRGLTLNKLKEATAQAVKHSQTDDTFLEDA